MLTVAKYKPVGERRADLPAILTIPANNSEAALLLMQQLASREQDDAQIRFGNKKKTIRVRFNCCHDAFIVTKFINTELSKF